MRYETYSNYDSLRENFLSALEEQQNIVLQAGSISNPALDFANSVKEGLQMEPKKLECRFLYDAVGSELYEKICDQPEYYPTRTEARILHKYANEISQITGPCHLIELGSGSSVKTEYLLSAYQTWNKYVCYTPIDISASALRMAGKAITDNRPAVQVVGIHGTYSDSFPLLQSTPAVLLIFLGSTIGNFTAEEENEFWKEISTNLQKNDFFLLGIDLVKDVKILEAAYNDAAGVTAAFTKNYFSRMNKELNCSIDIDAIKHDAFYNREKDQIEIYAKFLQSQEIQIESCSITVDQDEKVLVEISRKFHLSVVKNYLQEFGFKTITTYTDENKWFGLILLQKM